MKILAYLPHHIDIPSEVLKGFDQMADFTRLSDTAAMSRVPGTNRWLVLVDDGAGILAIGFEKKKPTLADVLRAMKSQEVSQ
jgi:hypothetical protein